MSLKTNLIYKFFEINGAWLRCRDCGIQYEINSSVRILRSHCRIKHNDKFELMEMIKTFEYEFCVENLDANEFWVKGREMMCRISVDKVDNFLIM